MPLSEYWDGEGYKQSGVGEVRGDRCMIEERKNITLGVKQLNGRLLLIKCHSGERWLNIRVAEK